MEQKFLPMSQLPPLEGLPDALNGASTPEQWRARREEIKEILCHYMLGHLPEKEFPVSGEVLSAREVYGGKGVREEIRLDIGRGESFEFYLVRPAREGRFPAIVWTYFVGRSDCPIGEELVDRGYVLAAFENNALCKDDKDNPVSPAKRVYPEADWGAILIWAWGFSKIADYLCAQNYVDAKKLICTGHSRNGKAALIAGAMDERFQVVAPNNSGCGGAGCLRYLGDTWHITQNSVEVETVGAVMDRFPHWFVPEFADFGNLTPPYPIAHEDRLPLDAHFFRAMIAPRGVISIEGTEDLWANCYGSYLMRLAAQPVFELYGVPGRNFQIIRNGPHGHTHRGWHWILDFAEEVFSGRI